jgi:ubiquinone/menaquinone biosynthesis C-methylase UbiE
MSFDRLAPHYDWLEALTAGNRLQLARTTWLEELRDCRRILSVGEGHGRFASACATRFPAIDLTCVDSSPAMLVRARKRSHGSSANIHWQCENFSTWVPAGKYDGLVSCFFLDCFPPDQLAAVIAKLAACASPRAVWLITDFAVPERGLSRARARAVHALMYAFFRLATALPARHFTAPDALLEAQGFHLAGRRESEWGLLRADLWRRG